MNIFYVILAILQILQVTVGQLPNQKLSALSVESITSTQEVGNCGHHIDEIAKKYLHPFSNQFGSFC
jgi:hypothetical protein